MDGKYSTLPGFIVGRQLRPGQRGVFQPTGPSRGPNSTSYAGSLKVHQVHLLVVRPMPRSQAVPQGGLTRPVHQVWAGLSLAPP